MPRGSGAAGTLTIHRTIAPMSKPSRPEPLTLRKLLEIVLAVAALELAFFLFRLGAAWWNR
jgi:hypothetical protein